MYVGGSGFSFLVFVSTYPPGRVNKQANVKILVVGIRSQGYQRKAYGSVPGVRRCKLFPGSPGQVRDRGPDSPFRTRGGTAAL
jgi:hypothetical protein